MIVLKKASLLFIWLLVLNPSSAFLPDKCNIELDPTKLFQENVDVKDVLKGAVCVASLLKTNYNLVKKFSTTFKFIDNLIQKSTSATTNYPACVGTGVYSAAVMLLSHYYAIEAKKQLMQAKFEVDDLNMAIDSEIVPILGFVEKVLIKEGSKSMKKFCLMNTYFEETLGNAAENLKNVRKNIEEKMKDSKISEENQGFFQKISAAAGVGGLVLAAAAPCPLTAFLVCPAMMAGTGMVASGTAGYFWLGKNKLTHQETFELLEQAKMQAMLAEEALRRGRVNIAFACEQYKTFNQVFERNELDR